MRAVVVALLLPVSACIPSFPAAHDLAGEPSDLPGEDALGTDLAADLTTVDAAMLTLSADPSPVQFGARQRGRRSPGIIVTLHNDGGVATGALELAILDLPNNFFIDTHDCGSGIAAGGQCSVTVSYLASTSATQNARLHIASASAMAVFDVPLDGNAFGSCVGGVAGGTPGGGAAYQEGGSVIGLSTGQTTGTFDSIIFNMVGPHLFTQLGWAPRRPYGAELPAGAVMETTYSAGNADMTGNVLLLHLNEATGTAFADSSGHSHNAACTACPMLGSAGQLGRGATFNAAGPTRIVVGSTADLKPVSAVTVEAWAAPSGIGAGLVGGIAGQGRQEAEPWASYAIEYTAGEGFRCYVGTTSGSTFPRAQQPTDPGQGSFHHVACVYNGSTVTLYVDGVSVHSVARSGDIAYNLATNNDFTLGTWGSAGSEQVYKGAIDEVAVFSRALGATEIADHYLRGATRLGLQVRSCTTADCSGVSFTGPGLQPGASFSEACNPTGTPIRALTMSTACSTGTNMLEAGQYWQLRVTLQNPTTTLASPLVFQDVSLCD